MGLLADIYSTIDTGKRRLKGLLDDPAGTIDAGARRFREDNQANIGNMLTGYGLLGNNSVLLGQAQKDAAQRAVADAGANMGMSAAISTKALAEAFPNVDFSLLQRGNQATLSKVIVSKADRGNGTGTAFMNALTKAADADGTQLALSPSGDFGGSKSRLVDFYKQFGFVPNKGRNIDFSISESMRREPK